MKLLERKKKMRLIICGPVFNEDVERKLVDASPAAGKFLNNMIDAIENNSVEVIKAVYLTYPVIDKQYESIANQYQGNDFITFKSKMIIKSVLDYQKRVLSLVKPGTGVIFYNISYPYFSLCKKIEKLGGKCLLLLADHTNSNDETKISKKIIARLSEKEFKNFRRVVSLSDVPNVKFHNGIKKLVVHGGIKNSDYTKFDPPEKKSNIIVTYAGLLSNVTGVDNFLKAIAICQLKNVEFHISGKGDLEEAIEKASLQDNRIKYLGFMTQDKYLLELKKANIMINPRNMDLEQNSNNFPSKVLEYLATGRLIISTRFSGYKDFEKNIIFYDGSPETLASCIDSTVSDYNNLASKHYDENRKLALEYDWNNQVKKIIQLFDSKFEF